MQFTKQVFNPSRISCVNRHCVRIACLEQVQAWALEQFGKYWLQAVDYTEMRTDFKKEMQKCIYSQIYLLRNVSDFKCNFTAMGI